MSNTNQTIIKQQITIMINDFFIDKLVNKNHRSNGVELNLYLTSKIKKLEETLNIDFEKKDIEEAFIEVCEDLNVFSLISNNRELSKEITLDIIGNKITFNEVTCEKITNNILSAYEGGFDINSLYHPIKFDNQFETVQELINENVFDYLHTNKKWQQKEAIGTINTFLEASEYSSKDIAKLYNKSKSKKDFIKNLAIEINKSSLISAPFQLRRDGVEFTGKSSGLYDFFMYSEKSKKFALNFSTRSKTTEVDGESLFKHTLSALAIINKYCQNDNIDKRKIKRSDTVFQHIFEEFAHYSKTDSFKEGRGSKISEKYSTEEGIQKFQYQDQCIKGVNKRLSTALSEVMKSINPDSVTTRKANMVDDSDLISLVNEIDSPTINNIYINNEDLKSLFDSTSIDFKIYYFGEVDSSKEKKSLSDKFTNEELRAGINMLAYAGKNLNGFSGIKMDSKSALSLIERINYRFNTSTLSNDKCLDIEKLNSNIRNIGAVFIEKFMLNPNPFKLITENYEKESNTILENISYFERNVLNQIIEGITINNQSPEQAYALTMGEFNIIPKLNFETFLKNLEDKWDYLSDEKLDNGNSLLIKQLKFIVEARDIELKQQQKQIEMIDKMLDKGFSEKEIIEDNYYDVEILINKFGFKSVNNIRNLDEDIINKYEKKYNKRNYA